MKRRTLLTGVGALAAYRALPANALVGGADKAVLSAKPVANTSKIGSIFNATTFANLNSFNVGGTTFGTSAGAITVAAPYTGGAFGNYLEVKSSNSSDENVDFLMTTTAVTLGGSAFGMGIGRASSNTSGTGQQSSVTGNLTTQASPNTLILYPYGSGNTSTNHIAGPNNCTGAAAIANDVIQFHYQQRGMIYTFTATNTTSGVVNSITATCNLNAVGGQNNFFANNVATWRIFGFGTTWNITSVSITSASYKSPKIITIGDSKTQGYDALTVGARFSNLLHSPTTSVYAGQSDKTADVLLGLPYILANVRPQYAILNIGRNDLALVVATGTWQANYASIVSQLKAAGIRVVHLMPIPETNTVQTTLTAYINATFPNDPRVDVTPEWTNAADLGADGIHPNVAGHALIANQLNNSGYLT